MKKRETSNTVFYHAKRVYGFLLTLVIFAVYGLNNERHCIAII